VPFSGTVWRVTREGRDPLQGGRSRTRWCDDTFDVLYTSLEANGALAEVYAQLAMQPVFPSVPKWLLHELAVATSSTLRLADVHLLTHLGVDPLHYRGRDYGRTQEIAEAAHFLGFDGVVAPSARWDCLNLMIFTDRTQPDQLRVVTTDPSVIDWTAWRNAQAGKLRWPPSR
jgi:RES domain-containing protein